LTDDHRQLPYGQRSFTHTPAVPSSLLTHRPEDTGSARPTQLGIGRDHALQLYVCVMSYDHPHLQNIQ
jgi:hypothetical protein